MRGAAGPAVGAELAEAGNERSTAHPCGGVHYHLRKCGRQMPIVGARAVALHRRTVDLPSNQVSTEPAAVVFVPAPPPPYDWRKTLWKGIKPMVQQAGAAAVLVVVTWLANPEALKQAFSNTPALLALVPVLSGIANAYLNWQKHRED